jgi:transposase-like protein
MTNAIVSLNSQLRKPFNARRHFPNGDAAAKLPHLAWRSIATSWHLTAAKASRAAGPHLKLPFGARLPDVV